jgi:Flp pilus assembly protein CpaB
MFIGRPVEMTPPIAGAASVKVVTGFDTVMIPVPLRTVARGERLAQIPLSQVKWPNDASITPYLRSIQGYEDSVATFSLPANLPIPLAGISKNAVESNAVVDGIPDGMRAITVRVDAESAVEGWARSGNFVDVIVLRQSKKSGVGIEAKVIAENVRILSAGRSTEPLAGQASAPSAPATVTLLTTQEDALKVKTAASVGKLTFSLRGFDDEAPTLATAMSQKTLLDEAKTFFPKQKSFRGIAVGPNGRKFVLGNDSRWIESGGRPFDSQSIDAKARARLDSGVE